MKLCADDDSLHLQMTFGSGVPTSAFIISYYFSAQWTTSITFWHIITALVE